MKNVGGAHSGKEISYGRYGDAGEIGWNGIMVELTLGVHYN